MLSQERLREISETISQRHGPKPTPDFVAINMVHPRLGHAYWRIGLGSLERLRLRNDREFYDARLVLRLYDATDIRFDGANAHWFTDLETSALSGNYYIDIDRIVRDYIAEIGLRRNDGSFCPLARSNVTRFDRDNVAGNRPIANLAMEAALSTSAPPTNDSDTSTRGPIPWPSYG